MSPHEIRRAILRTTIKETQALVDVDGKPLVFPNPSHCVAYLNSLRENQRRTGGTAVYVMVPVDDPNYKKLLKEKRTCQSH